MTKDEAQVGTRVKALRPFTSVPEGTEGVIDDQYEGGVMVAWDLPDHPLPEGYREWDGKPAIATGILRDGFAHNELDTLATV